MQQSQGNEKFLQTYGLPAEPAPLPPHQEEDERFVEFRRPGLMARLLGAIGLVLVVLPLIFLGGLFLLAGLVVVGIFGLTWFFSRSFPRNSSH